MPHRRALLASALMLAVAGCGDSARRATTGTHLRPDQRPVPVGIGHRYRIEPVSPAVRRHRRVAGLPCLPPSRLPKPYGVHLELFARGRVLPVPAGIGVGPPQRRHGAYVLGGACSYGLRTLEPTGVIEVSRAPRAQARSLGQVFALWSQPLTPTRLASFRGRVLAFVNGRPWRADPGSIPLRLHDEIVLEIGRRIPPHPTYRFPPGL